MELVPVSQELEEGLQFLLDRPEQIKTLLDEADSDDTTIESLLKKSNTNRWEAARLISETLVSKDMTQVILADKIERDQALVSRYNRVWNEFGFHAKDPNGASFQECYREVQATPKNPRTLASVPTPTPTPTPPTTAASPVLVPTSTEPVGVVVNGGCPVPQRTIAEFDEGLLSNLEFWPWFIENFNPATVSRLIQEDKRDDECCITKQRTVEFLRDIAARVGKYADDLEKEVKE